MEILDHRSPPSRFSKPANQSHLRTTFILLKLSFLVLGFVSFIHLARFALPSLHHFTVYTLPSMWLSLCGWLTPPYLYIILNFIILTIAATSNLHQKLGEEATAHHKQHQQPEIHHSSYEHQVPAYDDHHHQVLAYGERSPSAEGTKQLLALSPIKILDEDASFLVRSNWSPAPSQRSSSYTPTRGGVSCAEEKPLVSSRFTHKKSPKASPDTKPLRIARPKKEETLENTWKTITEGRHPPLARHLRKSDTWDTSRVSPQVFLRKSETMNGRGQCGRADESPSSPGSKHGLKREPSLTQDELNKRVEAFISKFNMEMRLQRQESFTHYMEMVNRGSH